MVKAYGYSGFFAASEGETTVSIALHPNDLALSGSGADVDSAADRALLTTGSEQLVTATVSDKQFAGVSYTACDRALPLAARFCTECCHAVCKSISEEVTAERKASVDDALMHADTCNFDVGSFVCADVGQTVPLVGEDAGASDNADVGCSVTFVGEDVGTPVGADVCRPEAFVDEDVGASVAADVG